VDLDPVIIDDPALGISGENIGALPPGACVIIDSGTITALDSSLACATPGPFPNIASATGTPPVGGPVNDNDPANVFCADPKIRIIKRVLDPVTGLYVDANNPPGPLYQVGTVVSYPLEVCNDGNVDLDPVIIDDPALGITGVNIGALAAGACTTIDAGTITELDSSLACAIPGPFPNTAFAVGTPPVGPTVDDNDPANVLCEDVQCELMLDLECSVPPPPTGQVCTTRPMQIVFEYTGDDCSATNNLQENRVICDSLTAPLAADVVITYVGSDAGTITMLPLGGNQWALTAPEKLQSNSPFEITDLGGVWQQSISMHTSCSKPLAINDQFGALKVVEIVNPDGTVIGGVPVDPVWNLTECMVYKDQTECEKRSTALGFRFHAGDCSLGSNTQASGKYECNDITAPAGPGPYELQFNSGGGVYKTILVNPGDEFEILASEDGRSDFASQTDWEMYEGTTLLQTGTFHTSCSQNLFIGDFYGNLEVVSFTNSEQGFVTANNAIDLRYTVTNIGTPDIDRICVGDDNATPVPAYFDAGDDVLVTPPDCDITPDAADPLTSGQSRMYYRTAQFSGDSTFMAYAEGRNPTSAAAVCNDSDPVTIMVVTPPTPIASCDTGKPQGLVFEYTGGDCSASTNDQEGKAKCEGPGPGPGAVEVKYSGKGKKHITLTPEGEVVVTGGGLDSFVILEASRKGKKGKKLESNTKLEIKQGGDVVQKLEIHTSCSKPLNVGDVFGSLTLREFIPYVK
jgi:hypothetical protein